MSVLSLLVDAVLDTSAKFSIQIEGADATLEVDTDPAFGSVDLFGVDTAKNGSGFCLISATGLIAATQYYYRAKEDGVTDTSITGQFRTAGTAGTPQNMLIAASGCAQGTNFPGSTTKVSNSPIFDTIRSWDPDLFLHLGDAHYRNINANDISLYRAAYSDMLAEPRQNQFWRELPTTYVWDDHDWANNDSDSTALGSAEVSQAFREIFPSYTLPVVATTGAIYRSFERGRVLFIVSDTRHERVPGVTMLGSAQKTWMEGVLNASTAEFFVWVNPTPWMGLAADTWSGFEDERDEIRDMFVTTGWADRMVCLNADYHGVAMDTGTGNEAKTGATWPVYLWCALDSGLEAGETGSTQYDMGTASVGSNRYGLLDITDDGDLITVTGTAYIDTTPWRSNTQHIITTAGTVPPRELSLLYDDDLSRIRVTSTESVPFVAVDDTFTRSVTDGWGTSDSGHVWSTSGGTAAAFDVNGTGGTVTIAAANDRHFTTTTENYQDLDIQTSVLAPTTPTGANVISGLVARKTDDNNAYFAWVVFSTTGALTLTMSRRVAGTFATIATLVMTETHVLATPVWIRYQIQGTIHRAKAWLDGATEPDDWMITGSDSTFTSGLVGTHSVRLTGNTNSPYVFTFDNLEVLDPPSVFLRFERSTNQISWTTVRGGAFVQAFSGTPVTVDDYEFTPDVANYYRVTVMDSEGTELDSQEGVTTPTMGAVWIKSPSRPFLNQKVWVIDIGDVAEPSRAGVFPVVGSRRPVSVGDVRLSRTFDLQLLTDTFAEKELLRALFSTGEPLLIHVPAACPIPVPNIFGAVGDVGYARAARLSEVHVITVPLTEVDPPDPDVVGATITYDGVAALYATYDDLIAEDMSYQEVSALVGAPADVIVD